MSAIADNRMTQEPDARPQPEDTGGRRRGALLAGILGLLLGALLGTLLTLRLGADSVDLPYLDAEFTYLGAIETWPAEPGSQAEDPFGDDVSKPDQVHAGRTACTRASDPGMGFDGMTDLLGFDPHQTFVILTEAADKLCPSQADTIERLLE